MQAMVDYWFADGPRAYHHTAPINMVYALHEGLRVVQEEGLEARWARHAQAHEALRRALAVLGFERLAPDGEQLSSLLAVRVPEAIDEASVRGALLKEDGIEVSGGLGPLAGQAWRIGVMGEGARPEPQERLVRAVARRVAASDEQAAVDALQEAWA
jgi:alanine-glyoxylate transaminase/serine-glyoxylate transaminase/serine-pyruvate transaminase